MEFVFQASVGGAVSGLMWWVWLATLVAWSRTHWHEWFEWLFALTILVGLWLFCTIWAVIEREKMVVRLWAFLGVPVGLALGLAHHGFHHLSGFRSLWDWLRFATPDPQFRITKRAAPPKSEGLWVPEAFPSAALTRQQRLRTCAVEMAVVIILLIVFGILPLF